MSAIEMQSLLARIYVDEYCRKLFLHQPELVLKDYRLTAKEKGALAKIDVDRLDYYAESLVKKRKQRLLNQFPLLRALSRANGGAEVERLFERFHGLHPAVAEVESQVEIQIFAAFLCRSLSHSEEVPAYAREVVRYDLACYEAIHSSNCRLPSLAEPSSSDSSSPVEVAPCDIFATAVSAVVRTFDYDIIDIASSIHHGSVPEEVQKQETTTILQNKDGKLSVFTVSGPTATLLQTLNGQKTVQKIVGLIEEAFGVPGLREDIIAIVRQLEEKEVIERVASGQDSHRQK